MGRPEITDRGLSGRLGQTVFRTNKSGSEQKGKLVYYPKGFAVLLPDKEVIPIKLGDGVSLRRGSGFATYRPHYVEYEYIGN